MQNQIIHIIELLRDMCHMTPISLPVEFKYQYQIKKDF
jgi:hypothetical protein